MMKRTCRSTHPFELIAADVHSALYSAQSQEGAAQERNDARIHATFECCANQTVMPYHGGQYTSRSIHFKPTDPHVTP